MHSNDPGDPDDPDDRIEGDVQSCFDGSDDPGWLGDRSAVPCSVEESRLVVQASADLDQVNRSWKISWREGGCSGVL